MIEMVNISPKNLIRIKIETKGPGTTFDHIAFAESYLKTWQLSIPEFDFKFI